MCHSVNPLGTNREQRPLTSKAGCADQLMMPHHIWWPSSFKSLFTADLKLKRRTEIRRMTACLITVPHLEKQTDKLENSCQSLFDCTGTISQRHCHHWLRRCTLQKQQPRSSYGSLLSWGTATLSVTETTAWFMPADAKEIWASSKSLPRP